MFNVVPSDAVVFWSRTAISPRRLRRALAPDIFYLHFDAERDTMRLTGAGECEIVTAQCGYETAARFAHEFGLEPSHPERSGPCVEWGRLVPTSELTTDGSPEAETLKGALSAARLPYVSRSSSHLSLKLAGTEEDPGKYWFFKRDRDPERGPPGAVIGTLPVILRSITRAGERYQALVREWKEKHHAFCAS